MVAYDADLDSRVNLNHPPFVELVEQNYLFITMVMIV